MTTLKQLQEHEQKKDLTPPVNPDKRSINKEDDLIDCKYSVNPSEKITELARI